MKQEKINLVRNLRKLDNDNTEYLKTIPAGFSIVFDNDYTNNQSIMIDLLIKSVFKENAEEVFWFIGEFTPGKSKGPHIVLADKTEYTFKTDEDYYEYLRTV